VTAAGALLGPRPAVAALEEGEDRGLADYKSCLNKLDEQSRTIILTELSARSGMDSQRDAHHEEIVELLIWPAPLFTLGFRHTL